MVELVPDVHLIDGSVGCNTYIIIDDGITLVDTGLRGNVKKIYHYLGKLGYGPKDIKRIVITHAHLDHINCLPRLKKDTDATVMVSEDDAGIVEGKMPLRTIGGLFGMIFATLRIYYHFEPVHVDVRLKDGDMVDVLGGLKAILLKGHSEGNLGLYDEPKKLIFSSDTIRVLDGRLVLPNPKFTEDMQGEINSIKRLSELDFSVMLPGHGQPVMSNASAKVKELYHELKH